MQKNNILALISQGKLQHLYQEDMGKPGVADKLSVWTEESQEWGKVPLTGPSLLNFYHFNHLSVFSSFL